MAERTNGGKSGYGNPYIVLEHAKGTPSDRYKVVTSVNWNVSINIFFWMITFMLIIELNLILQLARYLNTI